MANHLEAQEIFEVELGQGEEIINLAKTTLLIAKCVEYPNLVIDEYLTRIEKMAVEIESRLGFDNRDPRSLIDRINDYLFVDQGFHGNEEDYYDPKNSFLNDLLERRTGIPITLSVLYMEIASRIGLSLVGVGFPGHFILKYEETAEVILIDPFNKGNTLSEEDCQTILNRVYLGRVQFQKEMLRSTSKKQIATRILHNLKNIYIDSKNFLKALRVVDMLLIINPKSSLDIRDRGLLYYNLECFSQALSDLETYIRLSPKSPDNEEIRNYIPILRSLTEKMN